MAYYESVFIARQDVSSNQVDGLVDSFREIIEQGGGQVTKKEYWGLRNLAYRIKKNRKGHYVLMNIDAPSDAVLEMERHMRISEDVVRYMSVRVKELEEGESIMLRSRGGRDSGRGPRRGGFDRGDRGDRGPRGDRGDRGDRGRPPRSSDEPAKTSGEPKDTTEDKSGDKA